MAYRDYLATEIALDHAEGLLTRREALRRLGLLGVGAAASVTLLAACSGDDSTAAVSSTDSSQGGSAATTSAATSDTLDLTLRSVASTTAPTPATAATASGADGIAPQPITFTGPASTLQGSLATAEGPTGAVLIIHENRGLTQHFKDLPGRFAGAGYTALSVDLLSRQGGTDALADDGAATAALGAASQADLTADARAGLDELARRHPDLPLAVIGFCFGGGQVWSLLAAGETRLRAAAPFYGPGPTTPDFSGSPNAAVLAVYAELDSRVNASRQAMDDALTTAGLTHEVRVYPGVDHAFFNDTGSRYDATQATAAFDDVLAWFAQHLR